MSNVDRFTVLAEAFANELRPHKLSRIQLQKKDADVDGWWTPAAEWRRSRPRIGLFFDRILGGDQRHFWFGFYSSPARMRRLLEGVPGHLRNPAVITDRDFLENGSLQQPARLKVEQANGLAFEQYQSDEHYFGIYDIGFNATSDDLLANEAANFVGTVVGHIDPEFDLEADIEEIKKNTDIHSSARKQLIDAQKGARPISSGSDRDVGVGVR